MSRLDDLPPDQRATLSLLLRRRKSYAEVATMLDIEERAVHDRAHAALAVLATAQARELSAERREAVGDYLLGQHSGVAERLATRTFLDGSPQARAWANALAAELEPLAGEPLPEIPAGTDPAAEAASSSARPASSTATKGATAAPVDGDRPPPPAPRPRSAPASSRRGGALLLGAIVVIAIVVIVLVSSGGGSSGKSSTSAASEPGTSSAGTTGTAAGTASTGTQTAKAKEDRRITLSSPEASSKATGVAEVLSEGSQYAFYLAAQHLAPSRGFFYAVWLYNSPSSFEALSRAPSVGSNGSLQGGALLPKDAAKYHTMLLTRETATRPTSPGTVVLHGSFALH
jgi:hypothetical protein